jgi:uncharacterized lipoprotein YajG|tara:strand:+ start:355 stop:630 length:276 start_codon:yes stop_codon:yes gene_type:complete
MRLCVSSGTHRSSGRKTTLGNTKQKETLMKYLILVSALLLLSACGTMNAAIDGTQGIINTTLGAVGDGVADIAVAAGADVRGAVDTGKSKE